MRYKLILLLLLLTTETPGCVKVWSRSGSFTGKLHQISAQLDPSANEVSLHVLRVPSSTLPILGGVTSAEAPGASRRSPLKPGATTDLFLAARAEDGNYQPVHVSPFVEDAALRISGELRYGALRARTPQGLTQHVAALDSGEVIFLLCVVREVRSQGSGNPRHFKPVTIQGSTQPSTQPGR
jgi:hypothetical protein